MKRKLFFILFIFLGISLFTLCKGSKKDSSMIDFEKIIETFRQHKPYFNTSNGLKVNTVTKDSLFITKDFFVSVSNHPVFLDISTLVRKIDTGDKYPLSFTVIYGDHFVSLMASGKFVCFNKKSFNRDEVFENQLNSKKFIYHWLIDGQLVGKTKDSIYYWDDKQWIPYSGVYPMSDKPVLFEDQDFLVFQQCRGERGGGVFFVDKKSSNIYPFTATCANTVIKTDKGYRVVSSLNHLSAFSSEMDIKNPRKQKPVSCEEYLELIKLPFHIEMPSGVIDEVFSYYSLMIYSMFRIDNRDLYLCDVEGISFFAEIKGSNIEIVNPLFNKKLSFANFMTRSYGDYTLFCYTTYANFSEEAVFFVLQNNKLTNFCWNRDNIFSGN